MYTHSLLPLRAPPSHAHNLWHCNFLHCRWRTPTATTQRCSRALRSCCSARAQPWSLLFIAPPARACLQAAPQPQARPCLWACSLQAALQTQACLYMWVRTRASATPQARLQGPSSSPLLHPCCRQPPSRPSWPCHRCSSSRSSRPCRARRPLTWPCSHPSFVRHLPAMPIIPPGSSTHFCTGNCNYCSSSRSMATLGRPCRHPPYTRPCPAAAAVGAAAYSRAWACRCHLIRCISDSSSSKRKRGSSVQFISFKLAPNTGWECSGFCLHVAAATATTGV